LVRSGNIVPNPATTRPKNPDPDSRLWLPERKILRPAAVYAVKLFNKLKANGVQRVFENWKQGCGSGSQLDPDSIGSVDPDPYSESGSGSRRAKMTHKSRKY
jgi:hypothetical protein